MVRLAIIKSKCTLRLANLGDDQPHRVSSALQPSITDTSIPDGQFALVDPARGFATPPRRKTLIARGGRRVLPTSPQSLGGDCAFAILARRSDLKFEGG
jgi:hypothetical protein